MNFSTGVGKEVERAVKLLHEDQLVALPTETVYGLAGRAFSQKALASIFAAKERPAFDPLILHVLGKSEVEGLVQEVNSLARQLMDALWPGPLTLLLPKREVVPDLATSGLAEVGLRSPSHPQFRAVLEQLEEPLAAPSANLFGRQSPTEAQHVMEQLGGRIPYILDGGPSQVGIESTVVRCRGAEIEILRQGGVSQEQLARIAPVTAVVTSSSRPASPGQIDRHYQPELPMVAGSLEELLSHPQRHSAAFLSFQPLPGELAQRPHILLEDSGRLENAAKHFFSALRSLSQSESELILAQWAPERGLGRALNDKLTRASISPK